MSFVAEGGCFESKDAGRWTMETLRRCCPCRKRRRCESSARQESQRDAKDSTDERRACLRFQSDIFLFGSDGKRRRKTKTLLLVDSAAIQARGTWVGTRAAQYCLSLSGWFATGSGTPSGKGSLHLLNFLCSNLVTSSTSASCRRYFVM